MAKITIDWGDNVKIKEEYEVPYEVARAVDVLIEKYQKKKQPKYCRYLMGVEE